MEQTKWCRRCDRTLPVDSFGKSNQHRDGLKTYCRECCRKIGHAHYHANLESERAKRDKYRRADPKKMNARAKRWRDNLRVEVIV